MSARDLTAQEWEIAFGLYLEAAGVKHFTAPELCDVGRRHRSGAVLRPPPPHLWGNILPTVRIADELREHYGRPAIVHSGYRDPAYNAAIAGSADRSQHLVFRALDLEVEDVPAAEVANWLESHPESDRIGLGRYETFTHLDTRGRRARWGS